MISRVEFSWRCPPCLLSQLPFLDINVLDTSVSSTDSSDIDSCVNALPLASDVLHTPPVKLRVVHHNVWGLLSKWTDLQEWHSSSTSFAGIFVLVKYG